MHRVTWHMINNTFFNTFSMTDLLMNLQQCRAAFSSPWGSKEKAESEWNKEYDEPIFTSEPRNGGKYEKRTYSPSTWACTNLTVDTAAGTGHGHADDDGGGDHVTPST